MLRVGTALVSAAAVAAIGTGDAGAYVVGKTVTPGMTIFSGSEVCTAGFMVRTESGASGILTAGHCKKADAVRVQTSQDKANRVVVGTFERVTFDKPTLDLAVVTLAKSPRPVRSAILGKTAVAGVLSKEEVQDRKPRLCWQGQRSGYKCSEYKGIEGNRVFLGDAPAKGDSGAPVFAVRSDGSVDAVGIMIGITRDNRGLVELIQPRLSEWKIKLVASR
ncbi:hypothetical protein GCM10009551_053670 [Nocardiopsis tropica]|uniref:trypsin-like serine protease n=1 Tax=Tsukamurella strandjordii TaxID=147577 RepID=UPI0031CF8E2D